MASEQDRIAQTLTRVLRSREVETDPRGFVAVADAARVVGIALDLDLAPKDLSKIARRHRRFDLQNGRVRARERSNAPDIVYHACTQTQVERYLSQGSVRLPGGRPVFMSDDE
ncbi:MAG: hypothetical protein AAF211_27675, partial [Myxococcota bacterium]